MGVWIGHPAGDGYYLDDEELIRMRANNAYDPSGRFADWFSWPSDVVDLESSCKPPRFRREYTPGAIIAHDGKLYEILAAFRLVDEPHVWRFFCQEVPDLATTREVLGQMHQLGFNWADVLPQIVYDLFQTEHDAYQFFQCLFAQGRVPVLRMQEMLKSKVLLPARKREELIIDLTPVDPVHRLPDRSVLQLCAGLE